MSHDLIENIATFTVLGVMAICIIGGILLYQYFDEGDGPHGKDHT